MSSEHAGLLSSNPTDLALSNLFYSPLYGQDGSGAIGADALGDGKDERKKIEPADRQAP